MRMRLLAGLTATVMGVALAVVGPARPASAAVPYGQIAIVVASALFSRGGGATAAQLEQAKREIIEAINTSRTEIIGQIDAIASAEVRACTNAATNKFENIDLLDPFSLSLFTNDAVNCAALSSAFFDAVQTKAAADRIGNLLGIIYSIAMVGFAKLGFPTTDLLDDLIRSYENAVVKLAAGCAWSYYGTAPDGGGPPLYEKYTYTCTAHNGDIGSTFDAYSRGRQIAVADRTAAENPATRNTSRAIAQQALPTLRQLRATAT